MDKIIATYDRLLNYLAFGSNSLSVLGAVRDELGEKDSKEDIFLFTLVNSCFNNAILVMANIVNARKEDPKNSVDLNFLFNQMIHSKSKLGKDVYSKFISYHKDFSRLLEDSKIMPIIQRLMELRDQSIAHIDRKYVNDPYLFIRRPPLRWNDLDLIYYVVGNGLLEIGKYLNQDQEVGDIVVIANTVLKRKTQKIVRFAQQINLSSELTPLALVK